MQSIFKSELRIAENTRLEKFPSTFIILYVLLSLSYPEHQYPSYASIRTQIKEEKSPSQKKCAAIPIVFVGCTLPSQ